jgi:hypothetical protein
MSIQPDDLPPDVRRELGLEAMAPTAAGRAGQRAQLELEAEKAESEAADYYEEGAEVAEHFALTRATNKRLQALALQLEDRP